MEIVIGFLFVIGALALGSNASISDAGADRPIDARTEQTAFEQVAGAPQGPCRYGDGPLIQRDLTVPRSPAVPLASKPVEERGHACSDE